MTRFVLAAALAFGLALPAQAHDPEAPRETSTPIFTRDLPNVPGKAMIAAEVVYPPGGASPAHRHPDTAFIYAYVLSGEVVSAVDDEAPRVYRAGESWTEMPGARHRVSRNASATEPAKLLAIFVADSGGRQLVFPEDR
ncbi:cupin domain-containing protein [Salinarimonas soli]|uniref:Cupin domain-containing protein n=1 Tax=Salinarimonas soli TaxID=1638099 RepID=A0A5B2VVI9_9HYPH|nr:cupin domain-containing protein [Salinarimonas soli]KAA2242352.1 cupin domain-containing protein [Salinarimonas soli]